MQIRMVNTILRFNFFNVWMGNETPLWLDSSPAPDFDPAFIVLLLVGLARRASFYSVAFPSPLAFLVEQSDLVFF